MTADRSLAVPTSEIKDMADLLKVGLRTAYRMAETGEIPSYRVRGALRFDLQEVADAVRATRRPA